MNLKIREKLANYKRVLKLCKKPTFEDYKTTVKICGIGILVIGVIGFLFYIVSVLIG